jgi:NAD(P)-dependent dehydrogenase (short-subunit alcohol dehydrogenase family)
MAKSPISSNLRDMDGKVALVTGASTGLGESAARSFARRGAAVITVARREAKGEAVARRIRDEGGRALFVRGDVSVSGDMTAAVSAATSEYGRLDYAINNAGVTGEAALTADATVENWDAVMAVNVRGVFLSLKAEIPAMLEAGGGAIVNVSSGVGIYAVPTIPAYVASRHAVVGLTKSAALEYAPLGIRVNSICPGSIATPMHYRLWGEGRPPEETDEYIADMHPAGRIASPEEIANTCVWVCSDAASYVTGPPLVNDGGWAAR